MAGEGAESRETGRRSDAGPGRGQEQTGEDSACFWLTFSSLKTRSRSARLPYPELSDTTSEFPANRPP